MTKTPPENHGPDLTLFDDVPKSGVNDLSDGDPCRLKPIIDILSSHLLSALRAQPNSDQRQLRIGLFGGLGQGKTSAILQAIGRLRQDQVIPQRSSFDLTNRLARRGLLPKWLVNWRQVRFASFDTADYKPDVLEFEFDRLIGRWYLGRHLGRIGVASAVMFALMTVPLLPLAYLISMFIPTLGWWQIWGTLISVSIAWPFFQKCITFFHGRAQKWPVITFTFRDLEQKLNAGDALWPMMTDAIREVLFPPDVLIVDNLDRANVKQQRSILRAIRKHSERLKLPIIVVMDETELLQFKPHEAEAPEELLRKTILVECRMPLRMSDDAARLVTALAEEGRERNRGHQAEMLLGDARLQSDWTLLFSLLPALGPRRIKRFLNDLLSTCLELKIWQPDDVAALSRLYAVYELAPELQHQGEHVVFALAANDAPSLAAICGRIQPDERAQALGHLLHRTRHLQPQSGNWRPLVAKLTTTDATVGQGEDAQRSTPDEPSLDELNRLSDHMRAVGKGYAGPFTREEVRVPHAESELDADLVTSLSDGMRRKWLVVAAALGASDDPVERWRMMVRWRQDIADMSLRGEIEDESPACWLLCRVWLGDGEVLGLMRPGDREGLFREVYQNKDFRSLFLLVPGHYLHVVDRIGLASAPDSFGLRDLHSLGPWIATEDLMTTTPQSRPLFDIEPSEMTALVNLAWPPLTYERLTAEAPDCRDELQRHLTSLRQLHELGIPVRPSSLHASLFERNWFNQQVDHVPAVMDLLSHLLLITIAEQPDVEAVAPGHQIHLLGALMLYDEDRISDFLNAVSNYHVSRIRDTQTWWTGFFLGLYYDHEPICRRWNGDILEGRRSCHDLRLLAYLIQQDSSLIWKDGVIQAEAVLLLFGAALDGFDTLSLDSHPRCVDISRGLHRRLRKRRDYDRILSGLRLTPSVPPRAADFLDVHPSEDYLNHLRAVSTASFPHREATARQLVARAESAETMEIRNRSLVDAASLLLDCEIEAPNWDFVEIVNVEVPELSPEGVEGELWGQFYNAMRNAEATTPFDFIQMLVDTVPIRSDVAYDFDDYEQFEFYLPYLTVGLAPTPNNSMTVVRRLEWFIARSDDELLIAEIRRLGRGRIGLWQAGSV